MLNKMAKASRADDVNLQVACTMFEFYNGALKKVNYNANCYMEGAEAGQEIRQQYCELTI